MTLIVNESGGINLTLEIGQGPPGPSTAATQAAQLAAELARDEAELAAAQALASRNAALLSEQNADISEANALASEVSARNWATSTSPQPGGFESARTYALQAGVARDAARSSELTALNAAGTATEAASRSANSATESLASRDQASAAIATVNNLLNTSDLIKIYLTYQEALAALPLLTEGMIVKIIADESLGGRIAYYTVDKADPVTLNVDFTTDTFQLGNNQDRLVFRKMEDKSYVYNSYAEMIADKANLFDGQRVLVLSDETNFGMTTPYTFDAVDDQTLGLNFVNGTYAIGSATDTFISTGGLNVANLEYNLVNNPTNTVFNFVVNGNAVRTDADALGFRIRQAVGGTAGAVATLVEHSRVAPTGNQLTFQPAESPQNTSATLSIAQLQSRIITSNAAVTLTLPTGTALEGYATAMEVNTSFEVTFIATAANAITIAANGNTTVGSLTVAANSSGTFRFRKTALNTFTVYRVA